MTITFQEQPNSRAGGASLGWKSKQTRHWWAKGSTDITAIFTALASESTCPATITCPVNAIPLIRADARYRPFSNDHTKWDLEVDYADPQAVDDEQQLDTGDYTYDVSTTGGTARILTSLQTIQRYAPAGFTAPNFKQSIGVTREGDVQGVDIVVPACKFGVSYRQPKTTITWPYVKLVVQMTGTTNDDTFYGFAAGEVLFMGGTGRQQINTDPTWSYEFLTIPNLTGQTIGDILNVAKQGHQYLWVLFEEAKDSTAVYKVKKPKAVYVERVYQSTDFSNLGIGA